jgi:hypothetical protein
MKVTCFSLIILLGISSCSMTRYMKKKDAVVRNYYSDDTLYIHGFVFYDNVINSWGVSQSWSPYMSEDSVFRIFKNSLLRVTTNTVVAEDNFNFIDSTFHGNWRKTFDSALERNILSQCNSGGRLQLVPLIKFTQSTRSGLYYTSSGAAGGSRYLIQNKLYLIIYLIEDNSIVYSRAAFCLGHSYPAYDITEVQHTLTQKDWDELVALVMKDYIDRVQKVPINENFD